MNDYRNKTKQLVNKIILIAEEEITKPTYAEEERTTYVVMK